MASLFPGTGPLSRAHAACKLTTMRGRVVIGVVAAIVVVGASFAVAQQNNAADQGLPPFLTGDQDMPPGLTDREVLPPGLAKKLDDGTPPGQTMKEDDRVPPGLAAKGEGWLPPGLAKQAKIPPGHAKRLGVDPQPGSGSDDD